MKGERGRGRGGGGERERERESEKPTYSHQFFQFDMIHLST